MQLFLVRAWARTWLHLQLSQGDSGGPVAHIDNKSERWVVDALVSEGPEDCFNGGGEPGTNVKVSYFLESFLYPYLQAQVMNASDYRGICMNISAIQNCSMKVRKAAENNNRSPDILQWHWAQTECFRKWEQDQCGKKWQPLLPFIIQ